MPRVPQYQEGQVAARAAPQVQQSHIATNAPNMAEGFGNALGRAGQVLEQQQQHADELRVEDTFNQLREQQLDLQMGQQNGYVNIKGRNALPADGTSLSDRYESQFKGSADKLAETLANPRQKALFKQYADRAGLEFKSGLMRHENAEIDGWRKATVDGVISVESDNAAKNWNNPQAIDLSRGRIDINIGRLRETEGLPADQVESIRTAALSRLHSGVLDAAITNRDFDYADKYLKQYGGEMKAGDMLKATGIVTKERDALYATGAAQRVISEAAPAFAPNDESRLHGLVFARESGGKQLKADGTPVTSPKGAIGIAQIMPGTGPEAAKLAGLPWDEKRLKTDEGYNRALGTAYLNKQIQDNGGDVAKALAAYNAGPGALADAVKQAAKDGKPDAWLSYLPKETQAYVPGIMSQYQGGAGAPAKPTLMELEKKLEADPLLAASPAKLKLAREELRTQYTLQTQAQKQREDDAEGEVYRQLAKNGGDLNAIPPAVRSAMDPRKLDTAMAFAHKLRKGEDAVTNPALYLQLSTDEHLKSLSDGAFYKLRGDLSEADFKHFADRRNSLDGKATAAGGDLNSGAIDRVLKSRLSSMQVDPTPKDGSKDAAYVGALRMFVDRSIAEVQKTTGKKMTDEEVSKHVDGLFASNATFRHSVLGFDTGKTSVALLSMKPSDVPGDVKTKIRDAFKQAGEPAPDDATILRVYWTQRFGQKKSVLNPTAKN